MIEPTPNNDTDDCIDFTLPSQEGDPLEGMHTEVASPRETAEGMLRALGQSLAKSVNLELLAMDADGTEHILSLCAPHVDARIVDIARRGFPLLVDLRAHVLRQNARAAAEALLALDAALSPEDRAELCGMTGVSEEALLWNVLAILREEGAHPSEMLLRMNAMAPLLERCRTTDARIAAFERIVAVRAHVATLMDSGAWQDAVTELDALNAQHSADPLTEAATEEAGQGFSPSLMRLRAQARSKARGVSE